MADRDYARDRQGRFTETFGAGRDQVPTTSPTGVITAPPVAPPAANYALAYETFKKAEPSIDSRIEELEERRADLEQELSEALTADAQRRETDRALRAKVEERRAELSSAREAALTQAREGINEAKSAARRLYVEAGVSERFADFYASDVASMALKGREAGSRGSGSWSARPINPVRMLKKNKNLDATTAAQQAAKTDPEWQAAAHKVKAAVDSLADLDADKELNSRIIASHRAGQATLNGDISKARRAIAAVDEELSDLYARRTHGVPLQAEPQRLHSRTGAMSADSFNPRDGIVRNPDGSTNAWVKTFDKDTLAPRYSRVVGVEAITFAGYKANALLTEDGDKVYAVTHIFNGPGDGWNTNPTVVVTPPAAGASPLRGEGNPDAGFHVFVDTTD